MDSAAVTFEPVETQAAWERLLAGAAGSVWQQSWAYGAAARRAGRLVERLRIDVEGVPLGAVQLIGRRALAGALRLHHALGGPTFFPGTPPPLLQAALRALRRRQAGFGRLIMLTPAPVDGLRPALRAAGLRCVMTGYNTAILPLHADERAQARLLRSSWRRSLKRPPPELSVRLVQPAVDPLGLERALAAHEASRRRRGYAALPAPTVAHAARYGRALLAAAEIEGRLEAFMLFMLHGNTATYQLGWSSDRGRAAEAHHHLLWASLGELRQAGAAVLDLGGIDLPRGIVAFKLATGATPVTFPGTYL